MERRVLEPSVRHNLQRLFVALGIGAFGIGGVVWGAWPLAVVLLAFAGWLLSMTALVAFKPHAYELELDADRFRVHDVFGRVVHDVRWDEVVDLVPVGVNGFSFSVVAWVCAPRRPKRGRLRWVRGSKHDDGCLPDHYGHKVTAMLELMYGYWQGGGAAVSARAVAPPPLQAF